MTFDVATGLIRAGLEDTPENEALVEATLNVALAAVENYLDRKFMYDSQVDSFYWTHWPSFALSRYPIDVILNVTSGADRGYEVHHSTGEVLYYHLIGQRRVTFSYTGGYKVLPADLELALWLVFDTVLSQVMGSDGGSAGGSLGSVESITVPDVGTVRFASTASSSSVSSDGSGLDVNPNIPYAAQAMLRPYRREKA